MRSGFSLMAILNCFFMHHIKVIYQNRILKTTIFFRCFVKGSQSRKDCGGMQRTFGQINQWHETQFGAKPDLQQKSF